MRSKFIKYFLFPSFLFCCWLLLSIWSYLEVNGGLTTLTYQKHDNVSVSPVGKRLFAGEKVTGEFIAKEDNLGSIFLHTEANDPRETKGEETIQFRIKEKGATSWHQVNNYSKFLFIGEKYYPFGFAVISNSKNKTFEFELELQEKTFKGYLVVENDSPILISKYNFTKQEIFSNTNTFFDYCLKKIKNSNTSPQVVTDLILSSLLYAIPLFVYLIAISPLKDILMLSMKKHKRMMSFILFLNGIKFIFIFTVLFIGICVDIFFLHSFHDIVYLVLLLSWLFTLLLGKLDYRITFIFAFIFLFFTFILLQFNYAFAKNAMLWVYFFIVLGVIHLVSIYFQEILKAREK